MLAFEYHPDIALHYPLARAGVLLAQALQNGPTPPELAALYRAEQEAVKTRLGDTPLSELETLSAWRGAFRAFGVNPTKYRSAAEALLRRLTKQGDIPSINALVDLCNLVSIRYALPVAAFDVTHLEGRITVHLASGVEVFNPLGAPGGERPEPGEVIFSDSGGLVVARRWCWRQSIESAAILPDAIPPDAQPETRRAIIVVETQHPGGENLASAARQDLAQLLARYCQAELSGGLVGPGRLRFDTLHTDI